MDSSDEKLTKSFYDRISHSYDLLADSNEHVAREKGLTALGITEGEKVLEIGYGTGHSLVSLAKAVGATGEVFGVDISDGMQKVSEKRVTDAGVADRVKLSVAITPPLPFEDHTFDAVSMSFTLELFPLDTIPYRSRGNQTRIEAGRTSGCCFNGFAKSRSKRQSPRKDLQMDAPAFPAHCRLPAD